MGYTFQTIKGVSWIGGIRGVTRVLTLVKTLIIARILTPSQFGVFGVATLVLALIEILTETGVNIFLVQQKEDVDKYINTAWIVSIFRGLVIACLIIILAPFISLFFKSSQSYQLLLLIAFVPLIRGFINPSVIKFQKTLMFNNEFYYRTSIFFVETLFSIVLILILRSVESLIWGMLVSAAFEVFLSYLVIKPIPKWSFNLISFKRIVHQGKWITLSGIFNYFYQHGDDIAIGRVLGTRSLGLYDMAYRLSLVPISDISDVISKVTFPVYIKISDDLARLRRAFLRSLMAVFLLVLPIGIILYLFPEEIIKIAFGNKWLEAVPALKVLAILGVLRAVSVFTNSLFLSVNKQNIISLSSFIGLVGLGITIIPFVSKWGIVGAALSAIIGTVLSLPVTIFYLYKILYKSKV